MNPAPPPDSRPATDPDPSPFREVRYALPELLRDVQRDRSSMAFAMEKLDQAAINALFEQPHPRHGGVAGA